MNFVKSLLGLLFFLISCESKKIINDLEKDLIGEYDLISFSKIEHSNEIFYNSKIIFKANHTFYIESNLPQLNKKNGKWNYELEWDVISICLRFNNCKESIKLCEQKNTGHYLVIKFDDKFLRLYFQNNSNAKSIIKSKFIK